MSGVVGRMTKRLLLVVCFVLLVFTVWWRLRPAAQTTDQILFQAKLALSDRRFEETLRMARRVDEQDPGYADALMLAAFAFAELGQFQDAIDCCERVPASRQRIRADALIMAGNLLLEWKGRVTEAEEAFRSALQLHPQSQIAADRLAFTLELQGRIRESTPLRLAALNAEPTSLERLVSVIQADFFYPDQQLLSQLQESDPACPGLWLAASQLPMLKKDFRDARQLLEMAVEKDVSFVEAQVRLGQLLIEVGSQSEIEQWISESPKIAEYHPGYWMVMGQVAAREGNWELAGGCYAAALRLDPASIKANYQLGVALAKLGLESQSLLYLNRADALQRYQKLLDVFATSGSRASITVEVARAGAEIAESLKLMTELKSWCSIALQEPSAMGWAQAVLDRNQAEFAKMDSTRRCQLNMEHELEDLNLLSAAEVHSRLLAFRDPPAVGRGTAADPSGNSVPIILRDIADQIGLDFSFQNGAAPGITGQQWAYDFVGGGIGVLDLDSDSWPDVCLAQGTVLSATGSPNSSGQQFSDKLFRNHHGREYRDVTFLAGLKDDEYGQGVSVGDFDNDGFDDIFIGNIGRNRLLHGNGDGTFCDVSEQIHSDKARWTTSSAIVDLNRDSHPDILAISYLDGDYLSRVCRDKSGLRNSCTPQSFPAAFSQCFLNQGDGTFVDGSKELGFDAAAGKGLGLVVADLNDDLQPDVFVANDGTPNFLFVTSQANQGGESRFVDTAIANGVALNASGLTEACMGVVVEDLNVDSSPEVFVTNFYEESNTLYVRQPGSSVFLDQTWQSNLGRTSLKTLGFGAQTIDVELDGLPDLFIANGHVDDFSEKGIPYQMHPQFFRNRGQLHFDELALSNRTDYFKRKLLGRAVARLDWNRDGLEDLSIGHLRQPYALLMNQTVTGNAWIGVRLVGTLMDRDSFGSKVRITDSSGQKNRQLNAGCGYLASNERKLNFGLGENTTPVGIDIHWQIESRDIIPNVQPKNDYLIIQGRPKAYAIPH